VGSLYRIHELPDPSRVLDFEQFAATFGHSLGIDVPLRRFNSTKRNRDGTKSRRTRETIDGGLDISPRHYQRLISRIAGRPEERIVSYQMLRSLKQARYSEKNVGHFALGARTYTHFTSPIRRYPDLVVHRVLKHQIDAAPTSPYRRPGQSGALHTAELEIIASESSLTERRAADAERALLDWKKARFMEERLGDEFDAIVVGVIRYGLFVELTELFIEGFLPIDSFSRERYFFNENLRAFVGERTKRRFTLGDGIKFRADRISWDEMRPEFSWVDETAAKPSKRLARRKR
jgi:ribonuclease R